MFLAFEFVAQRGLVTNYGNNFLCILYFWAKCQIVENRLFFKNPSHAFKLVLSSLP